MSNIQGANIPASTVTLLESAARTTTAAGTAVTGFAAARLLVLQLEVTAASGTLPTLDVVVEDEKYVDPNQTPRARKKLKPTGIQKRRG